MRRVPVVEVGDHQTDVFTVPLEGIDAFLRDNDDYDYAYGELSAELGSTFGLGATATTLKKTIQPTNTAGEALFVKSTPTKALTSVVMKATPSSTLAAEAAAKAAAAKKAAEAAAAKKAADEAAAKKAAEEAAKKAAAAKPVGVAALMTTAVNRAQEAVAAAVAEAQKGAEKVASGANAINAALAASVGQTNKAPQISSKLYNAPVAVMKQAPRGMSAVSGSASIKVPSVSASAAVKPSVSAALTAPVSDVINKAATAIAAEAAAKAATTAQSDAVFKSPDRATPLAVKDVMMKATPSATLAAARLPESKTIQPPATVTARIDPGPYLTMKSSVAPLTQAKIAAERPGTVLQKIASLAPPSVSAIKALAQEAAQTPSTHVATLLEQLSQVGGPEKCACIVARKKPGLAALGVQSPTLRSKVPQKTFVASNRVDFQGQVLDALHQIEMNTSNEQLRAQLAKLRNVVG